MAYFAEIDGSGTVVSVIKIDNAEAPDPAPENSEPLGQAFIANVLKLPGVFKQCSYSGKFRKQYCGPGFKYDWDADVFISPKPFNSWVLNENYDWVPPTPMPENGMLWEWDEESMSWKETDIPLESGDVDAS